MNDLDFEALVVRGIESIRPDLRALMDNVAIVIADHPTPEQKSQNDAEDGGMLFGLYEGVPLPDRGIEGIQIPDKITIFKEPILALYATPDDIAACVENTVWHEIAHHFGYEEEWIAKEEERRGRTL